MTETVTMKVHKRRYDKVSHTTRHYTRYLKHTKKKTITGKENVSKYMFDYSRSFCAYIKHGERGKKDRRAIASGNIVIRFFLHLVEYFHLALAKQVEGNTISIGGDEKKRKIQTELKTSFLISMSNTNVITMQATEDATKWNECLNALLFCLVHEVFFGNDSFHGDWLASIGNMLEVIRRVFRYSFLLIAAKRISLGAGFCLINSDEYGRPDWDDISLTQLNEKNEKEFREVWHHYEKGGYMNISPGFLMGMFNAGSTTMGLLPVNHMQGMLRNINEKNEIIYSEETRVSTLRSSDDSMSVFSATSPTGLSKAIRTNYMSLKLLGIGRECREYCIIRRNRHYIYIENAF